MPTSEEHAAGPVVDLGRISTRGASGAIWSLSDSGDLNANLVRLAPGAAIGSHRNDEVDVLIYVRSGFGRICIGDRSHPVSADHLVLIERGAVRSIHAGDQGLTYLTVHRRRGPLTIGR